MKRLLTWLSGRRAVSKAPKAPYEEPRCELCVDHIDAPHVRCPNPEAFKVSDALGRPLGICQKHFERAPAAWVRHVPEKAP